MLLCRLRRWFHLEKKRSWQKKEQLSRNRSASFEKIYTRIRRGKERERERESDSILPQDHTKKKREKHKREREREKTSALFTHQTPHPADYKPVGNPGRDRSHAHESRQRRSRIRSHLPLFCICVALMRVFPYPREGWKSLGFQSKIQKKKGGVRWFLFLFDKKL